MAVSEKGIDVRQTGAGLIFRVHLRDSTGANLTSGTVNLYLYRFENDGTVLSYDFNDNTFKSTALTTEVVAMTHRQGNNNTTNTGVWTYDLNTVSGFTAGGVYLMRVECATAVPVTQYREWQYGSEQGDLTVTSARLDVNVEAVDTDTNVPTRIVAAYPTGKTLRQISTTATGASTTTNIVLAAVLGTDADDDLNGQLLIIYDASDSERSSIHRISDYTAASNTCAITPTCRFTPANGDIVEIWAVVPTSATGSDVNVTAIAGDTNTPARLNTALTVNAGAVGGMTLVKNAGPDLLNFTLDTGSTTTSIIVPVASLPSGHANSDYSGLLVVKDISAGGRVNVRLVSSYTASTRALAVDALGFTPEVGVDTATLWIASASTVDTILTELTKLTTGFSTTAPNTLQAYLKALSDKTAATPTGLGTFNPATDSVEALRELLDLMAGGGFSTSTDSLQAIRDAIDDLIAPNIISNTSLSGSGFLSDCVSGIRKAIDEPSLTPKYTDLDIVKEIQSAFAEVIADLNVNTDHPVLARSTVSVVSGTQFYQLPLSCAELLRVAKISTTTGLPEWEIWPGNEYSFTGEGFTIEGNTLRLLADWRRSETLQILYVPNAEGYLHKGTATSPTSTTLTLAATPTDGTRDTRVQAYAGWMIRILSDSNSIVQERIITDYNNLTRVVTVSVPFSPALGGTVVYEVLPQYSQLLGDVVCLYAARSILSNEGNTKRLQTITAKLQTKMRGLRLFLEKKNGRFLHSFTGDTVDNSNRGGWWEGSL